MRSRGVSFAGPAAAALTQLLLPAVLLAVIATSVAAAAAAPTCTAPAQIHTALGGKDARSWVISWATNVTQGVYAPTIYYGTLPSQLTHALSPENCSTTSYAPGPTRFHHCALALSSLKATALVYYSVGSKACGGFSPVQALRAPPRAGAPVRVAVFGDLGVEQGEATLASLAAGAARHEWSFVLHVGDISYADDYPIPEGERVDYVYEPVTDEFFARIQPVAARVPYMVVAGNHDVTCRIYGDDGCAPHLTNFSAYTHRWRMPSPESGGAASLWYAFPHGNVQFVAINTESDYPGAPYTPAGPATRAGGFGDQLAWLDATLAAANSPAARAVRPWVVVVGHRPLYSSSTLDYPSDQQERSRRAFEPLFERYGVDLFLSGHVHLFERSWPIVAQAVQARNYASPQAPVHVISGAGGNLEGHIDHVTPELPAFTAFREKETFGYGELSTRDPDAAGLLKLCHVFRASGTDAAVDEFCITKPVPAANSASQPAYKPAPAPGHR